MGICFQNNGLSDRWALVQWDTFSDYWVVGLMGRQNKGQSPKNISNIQNDSQRVYILRHDNIFSQ